MSNTDNTDERPTVSVEVTMKLVVESEMDPRDERGGVPYDFKHFRPTERVCEFLEHLQQRVAEWFAETNGVPAIIEFEVLDEPRAIEKVVSRLDALATDDLGLEGSWSTEVANERCQQYATLVRQLLEPQGRGTA